jgi:hypothetical protein
MEDGFGAPVGVLPTCVVLARVLGVSLDGLVPKKLRGLGAVLRQGRNP